MLAWIDAGRACKALLVNVLTWRGPMRARLVLACSFWMSLVGCAALLGIEPVPDANVSADASGRSSQDASDAAGRAARDGGFVTLTDSGVVAGPDGGVCSLNVPERIPCGLASCDPSSSRPTCCSPKGKSAFCADDAELDSCVEQRDGVIDCLGAADCPGTCCLGFRVDDLDDSLPCSYQVTSEPTIACAEELGLDAGCGGTAIACRKNNECPAGQTCKGFHLTTPSGIRELGTCVR